MCNWCHWKFVYMTAAQQTLFSWRERCQRQHVVVTRSRNYWQWQFFRQWNVSELCYFVHFILSILKDGMVAVWPGGSSVGHWAQLVLRWVTILVCNQLLGPTLFPYPQQVEICTGQRAVGVLFSLEGNCINIEQIFCYFYLWLIGLNLRF